MPKTQMIWNQCASSYHTFGRTGCLRSSQRCAHFLVDLQEHGLTMELLCSCWGWIGTFAGSILWLNRLSSVGSVTIAFCSFRTWRLACMDCFRRLRCSQWWDCWWRASRLHRMVSCFHVWWLWRHPPQTSLSSTHLNWPKMHPCLSDSIWYTAL